MGAQTYLPVRDSYPGLEVLRAKFEFQDSDDTWDVVNTTDHSSHASVTAADGGTGLVSLTFPICKDVQIFAFIDPLVTTQSSQRDCNVVDIDVAAGTATIIIEDKADAQADPVDLSILHVKVELRR